DMNDEHDRRCADMGHSRLGCTRSARALKFRRHVPIEANVAVSREAPGSQLKGSGFLEALRWIDRTRGRADLVAVHARMAAQHRHALDFRRDSYGLLASSWYPVGVLNAFFDALTEDLSLGQRSALARRLGTGIADGLASGVYQFLFSLFVSPERYCVNLGRMWRQSWTDGEVNARMASKSEVEVKLSAWKGHHVFNCEVNHYIAVALFEKMGIRNVTSTWTCKSVAG